MKILMFLTLMSISYSSGQDVDECASSPCLHGTCVNKAGSFQCLCFPGHIGRLCEIDFDIAAVACTDGLLCENHELTTTYSGRTYCCPPGYTRLSTRTDYDEGMALARCTCLH